MPERNGLGDGMASANVVLKSGSANDLGSSLVYVDAVANDQRQASQGQPDQSAGANGGQARGRAFQAALDTADDSASAALTSALAYRSRPATGVDIRI